MSQHQLAYESPQPLSPEARKVRSAIFVVVTVVLTLNGLILAAAAADRSFTAAFLVFVVGPIANAILLLASLVCIPLVRRAAPGASIAGYVTIAILLPLVAIAADFVLVMSMGLSGC